MLLFFKYNIRIKFCYLFHSLEFSYYLECEEHTHFLGIIVGPRAAS